MCIAYCYLQAHLIVYRASHTMVDGNVSQTSFVGWPAPYCRVMRSLKNVRRYQIQPNTCRNARISYHWKVACWESLLTRGAPVSYYLCFLCFLSVSFLFALIRLVFLVSVYTMDMSLVLSRCKWYGMVYHSSLVSVPLRSFTGCTYCFFFFYRDAFCCLFCDHVFQECKRIYEHHHTSPKTDFKTTYRLMNSMDITVAKVLTKHIIQNKMDTMVWYWVASQLRHLPSEAEIFRPNQSTEL